jgi:hypothetical protein
MVLEVRIAILEKKVAELTTESVQPRKKSDYALFSSKVFRNIVLGVFEKYDMDIEQATCELRKLISSLGRTKINS